jgi:hypothetical protein
MAKTCMGIEMNVWFNDPTNDDNDDDDNDDVDLANDYQSQQNTTKHGGCLPFCE